MLFTLIQIYLVTKSLLVLGESALASVFSETQITKHLVSSRTGFSALPHTFLCLVRVPFPSLFICFSETQSEIPPGRGQTLSLTNDLTFTVTLVLYGL